MANKERRAAVRMEESMWRWLRAVAEDAGNTPSWVVRRLVSHVMHGGVSMPPGLRRPKVTPDAARKAGGA